MSSRCRLLVATLVASAFAAARAPAQAGEKPGPIFKDGQAQLVPAFQDTTRWIHQELWVETNFDTDHDGKMDRMHVDVTRPAQTDEGLKVPIIMGSSPYYAGTGRPQVNWDVQVEVGATPPPREKMNNPPFVSTRSIISRALVSEWVPRGFAVVHSEAPGTGLSSGCPTVGDYPEREAPAAVIDWLNGRAKGFTTKT
ncbi:MAG TPA: CocE/NonD family hydrolase, partial [Gemmatimonadales bacterium]